MVSAAVASFRSELPARRPAENLVLVFRWLSIRPSFPRPSCALPEAGKRLLFGSLHLPCGFGVTVPPGLLPQLLGALAGAQELLLVWRGQQRLQRCLVAPVTPFLTALFVGLYIGLRARPVQVHVRI